MKKQIPSTKKRKVSRKPKAKVPSREDSWSRMVASVQNVLKHAGQLVSEAHKRREQEHRSRRKFQLTLEAVERRLEGGEKHTECSTCLTPNNHDLEQVRRQGDAIARKLDELSGDFIQREVIEPILRDMLGFYQNVLELGESMPAARIKRGQLTESFERILDNRGFTMVVPIVGEKFDPRRHESLAKVETDDPQHNLTIDFVYSPALMRSDKTVQQARVRVRVLRNNQDNKETFAS